MTMEIQILAWDSHTTVAELNQLTCVDITIIVNKMCSTSGINAENTRIFRTNMSSAKLNLVSWFYAKLRRIQLQSHLPMQSPV